MQEIKKIVPAPERCAFCHRRSNWLCDMPIGTVTRSFDFKMYPLTCGKPICDDCTTRVNGFDFCPDCVQKIRRSKKGLKFKVDYCDECPNYGNYFYEKDGRVFCCCRECPRDKEE